MELRPGQLIRAALTEQIGPPGASHDQAAAAEERYRIGIRAVKDRVGEVLRRMARGFDGGKPQPAKLDLVAVAKAPVRELIVAASRRRDRATGRGLDHTSSCQVVVMDVGFEDILD